jgi:insulysin
MSIFKSDNDYRNYDNFILDNQLEVLLIEDKKATLSAVSLCVNCGSYDDDIEGTAHFLEHMLFMGNKKYPDEKYYGYFINSHNGFSNAYTAGDHTNFYYNIDSNYLIESFDVFSNFFISPLFDDSCLSREMNAVDSEHKKNLQDDGWRNFQMIKNICSDKSPLSRFSTGNLATLNIPNIRNKIIEYFEKYYSSNIMKLVVLYNGTEDISKIKTEIQDKFGQIKNKNININRNIVKTHLNTNKIIKVLPIKDWDDLIIVFELEINDEIKNNNLLKYISYLLSHEGEGTLANHLYKSGKISSIYASEECIIGNYCVYTIKFLLNNTSDEIIDYILDAFKKYINILIESTNDKKILSLLEEDRFLNNQSFENYEISDEADHVSNLCSNLIEYNSDRKYLLKYSYIIGEFMNNTEIIKNIGAILNFLNLDNNNFSLVSISNNYSNITDYKEEHYYKIKYTEAELNFKSKSLFTGLFKFPQLNKYIIKDKSFVKDKSYDIPKNIYSKNNINSYLKINRNLNSKNSELYIQVTKNDIYDTPENYILYLFLVEYFDLFFVSEVFEIECANNRVVFLVNKNNYLIHVSSYHSNIDKILDIILNNMKQLKDYIKKDKTNFDIIKEKIQKSLKNKKYDSPYQQSYKREKENIYNKHYTTELLETIVDKFNLDNLQNFNFFNYAKIVVYCEGNINKESFEKINEIICSNFINRQENYEDINLNLDIVNKIIKKDYDIQNPNETNECTLLNIFISNLYKDSKWTFDYANLSVFDNIISREFFDHLRTKEQLGYIVKANNGKLGKNNNEYSYYEFLVQSNIKDAEYLEKRIIQFIQKEIPIIINELNDKDLLDIITTIKEALLKEFNNLEESSLYYYDKIINGNFTYNFNKIIASELDNVNKKSLLVFYEKYFNLSNYLSIKIKKKS